MASGFENLPTVGEEVKLSMRSVLNTYAPDLDCIDGESDVEYDEYDDDSLLDDEEPQILEVVTTATYAEENGRVTISYDESEVLGMPQTLTQITYRLEDPCSIAIVRTGGAGCVFVIEEGKRNPGDYRVGNLISLMLSIYGRKVSNTVKDGVGDLEFEYIVEMGGNKTQRTKMSITLSKL